MAERGGCATTMNLGLRHPNALANVNDLSPRGILIGHGGLFDLRSVYWWLEVNLRCELGNIFWPITCSHACVGQCSRDLPGKPRDEVLKFASWLVTTVQLPPTLQFPLPRHGMHGVSRLTDVLFSSLFFASKNSSCVKLTPRTLFAELVLRMSLVGFG